MNFSMDRDLLALEPGVFTDVPVASQERVRVADAVVAGELVSSVEADFAAAGAGTGSVVLIGKVAHEVVERVDAQTLRVSRLRARLGDAVIPPVEASDVEAVVRTFSPQAALVHDGLLRLLGIEPGGESGLGEESVVSLSLMARLEALGTLERVYSGAVALVGDNQGLETKAREYGRRFRAACAGASVLIDTNGDGFGDERRHLGLVRMRRV